MITIIYTVAILYDENWSNCLVMRLVTYIQSLWLNNSALSLVRLILLLVMYLIYERVDSEKTS